MPRYAVTCERWVGDAEATRTGDSARPLLPDFDSPRQSCMTYYMACYLYGYAVDHYRTANGYRLEFEAGPTARLFLETSPGTFEWIALAIEAEETS